MRRGEGSVDPERRLYVYNAGFLTETRVRRILDLAGWRVRLGRPGPGDWVGVWGASPTARRGAAVAARTGAPVLRVEDAFLRSVLPGRSGEPPLGLLLDRTGVHFDASRASDLETLLATAPLDDPALLARARAAIARIAHWGLSKYACWDDTLPPPTGDFVAVIDQARSDASLPPDADARFSRMLAAARAEHPDATIVIRTHPDTVHGHRGGYYGPADRDHRTTLSSAPIAPARFLSAARAVYTVSSTLGFEAMLRGHAPRVFGAPFYAGWGLSRDEETFPRRGRALSAEALFAGAMIVAPVWYDPFRDRLCEIETVIDILAARAAAWRRDRRGWVVTNASAWKRPHLKRMFGRWGPVDFRRDRDAAAALADRTDRPLMEWAGGAGAPDRPATRVEDGFLRSPGLGAALVPPSSLGLDDLGIHYDPGRPSRLDCLIAASVDLPAAEIERAARLRTAICDLGVSKYNLRGDFPDLPAKRPRILVVGQVDDDAAVVCARPDGFGNADLLRAARRARPEATLIYKVHPDVAAGLRRGAVPEARDLADLVLRAGDPARLLDQVDEVWTISSTLGFEALIRGVPVTCLGAPFYAGWGFTDDRAPTPKRRRRGPTLDGLVHAALIGYPRYLDPVTRDPCPAEVAVERLAAGVGFRPPGLLARLQRWRALIR